MNRHTHSSLAALLMLSSCMVALPVFAMPDDTGGGGGGALPGSKPISPRAALSVLDVSSDADWTDAGLPDMARMKALTGNPDLKRDDVSKVLPGFNRANADTAPSFKDPETEPATRDVDQTGFSPNPAPGGGEPKPIETGDLKTRAEAQAGADATSEDKAAAADGQTRAEHEAEVLEGTGKDETTTTAADALRADRKGQDFGEEDPAARNVVTTEDGRDAASLDVQEVGLREEAPLSDAEAQAQTAAALAGNEEDQADYDRGFIRGYELGKTESDKHATQLAKPAEAVNDYLTREARNAVDPADPVSVTHTEDAASPTDLMALAGGDAIALCEALVIAVTSDKYKRNSALTSFARGYLVSQGEIKEVQRRLDVRNEQRASESKLGTLKA